jgi:hypothetical protein
MSLAILGLLAWGGGARAPPYRTSKAGVRKFRAAGLQC